AERKELRSNIQLVYQNPYSSLDPRMRIGDIIAEPFRNFTRASKSKAQARAKEYLELVSLDADMYARRPRELSGGQRRSEERRVGKACGCGGWRTGEREQGV